MKKHQPLECQNLEDIPSVILVPSTKKQGMVLKKYWNKNIQKKDGRISRVFNWETIAGYQNLRMDSAHLTLN